MTVREPRLAARMRAIEPFHVMELVARAKTLEAQGRSIVHMEVGEPDFTTAEPMMVAGHRALDAGLTGYTSATGIIELRESISRYYQERYSLHVPPQRILLTPGATGALQLATALTVDPGLQVLMADPGYPCNRHLVEMMGGRAVGVPVGPDTDYQLTPELVDRNWDRNCVGVMVASPSNPTGTIVSRAHMSGIIEVVERRGGHLIVDEIYHGLTYGESACSVLELTNRAFVINSFSKFFGMTGWRLGWIVAPKEYVREAEKLAQNIFLAPPTLAQHAALAAFQPATLELLENRRLEFQRRRDYLLPALRSLGFLVPTTPMGAFYIYADCSAFTNDSFGLAMQAIDEVGVAVTPGIDFGTYRADSHLRFAYTTSLQQLQEGVRRLGKLLS